MAVSAACLAASLSRAPALRQLRLEAHAWSAAGEGLGLAGPFVALAAVHAHARDAPLAAGLAAPMPLHPALHLQVCGFA